MGKRASRTAAGFAGLIVPDLPGDEAGEFAKVVAPSGLALVQLVAPTTPAEPHPRHPPADVEREDYEQRRIHRTHIQLLTYTGQRGMKETTCESENAASRSEQQTNRRGLSQIVGINGLAAAKIVPADCDAVEADDDERQIRPRVSPSAK